MAIKSHFDFPHTCPKIDAAISECKDILQDSIQHYILELCPHIPESTATVLSQRWAKEMYSDISDIFESVRETNEEMREAANYQISDLEEKIEELKEELKSLEN